MRGLMVVDVYSRCEYRKRAGILIVNRDLFHVSNFIKEALLFDISFLEKLTTNHQISDNYVVLRMSTIVSTKVFGCNRQLCLPVITTSSYLLHRIVGVLILSSQYQIPMQFLGFILWCSFLIRM